MKKTFRLLTVLTALTLVVILSTAPMFAASKILGIRNGSDAANGTWDGILPKEAAGDSLVLFHSGDAFGFVFENIPAGVYKIAYYMTIERIDSGKQIRISPKVTYGDTELRCWVDWRGIEAIEALYDAIDDERGKILLVSVIHIPRDGATMNVGSWQDNGAYQGTLDKVVLATGDYDFKDNEYVLVGEKNYGADTNFNEDPSRLLFAEEGSWIPSTPYADAVAELGTPSPTPDGSTGSDPASTPTSTATATATPDATSETPTTSVAPTPSGNGAAGNSNPGVVIAIIAGIAVLVLAAVGYFVLHRQNRKERRN